MNDPSATSDARDTLTGGGDAIARLRMLFDLALDIAPGDRAGVDRAQRRRCGRPRDAGAPPRRSRRDRRRLSRYAGRRAREHARRPTACSPKACRPAHRRIPARAPARQGRHGGGVPRRRAKAPISTRTWRSSCCAAGSIRRSSNGSSSASASVLASLNHPNIARLIDGGLTDAGVPYLVMEYVDGEPITRYATARALDCARGSTLFLTVCRAVEAAHRALIVHRDIKPSNILVATRRHGEAARFRHRQTARGQRRRRDGRRLHAGLCRAGTDRRQDRDDRDRRLRARRAAARAAARHAARHDDASTLARSPTARRRRRHAPTSCRAAPARRSRQHADEGARAGARAPLRIGRRVRRRHRAPSRRPSGRRASAVARGTARASSSRATRAAC